MSNNLLLKISSVCIIALSLSGCAGSAKNDPYKGLDAKEIYTRGVKNTKANNYIQAIKDFEALETRYPYGEYADKGQIAIIYSYYKREEAASAIAAAERFVKKHPRHPQIDYVYYIMGLTHYEQYMSFTYRAFPIDRSKRDPTEARESFEMFKTLVTRFPKSKYAKDAHQRMIFLKDQIANHELHAARYYMKRGAYLAAANRANYIVENFQNSQAVPKALATMVTAYTKLGMENLALDARKVLEQNYPDFPEYFKEAKKHS